MVRSVTSPTRGGGPSASHWPLRSVAERKPLPLARVVLLKVDTPPEKKQPAWANRSTIDVQRTAKERERDIRLCLKLIGAHNRAPLRYADRPCFAACSADENLLDTSLMRVWFVRVGFYL